MVLFIIIASLIAAGVYAFINVANRRWDAVIRAREDYDEDVDGKQTKAQKAAFEARKAEEAKLTRMSFGDVYKERPERFIAVIIWGVVLTAFAVWFFMNHGEHISNLIENPTFPGSKEMIRDGQAGIKVGIIFLLILYAIYTLEALIDIDTMEIPPQLNIGIFVLALISIPLWQHVSLKDRIIGMLCITVPMLLLEFVLPGAFGGGDRRMLYGTGLLLGWKMLVAGFFIGAIIQAVIAVFLIASKKKDKKSHIPFGPMLCLGIMISTMFGTQLIDWYIGIIMMSMGR